MIQQRDSHATTLAFSPCQESAEPGIPEGFEELPTFGPFHAHLGPMYFKRDGDCTIVGLHVQDKHRNRGAMMHGGMVCTLADTASHWAARHARQEAPGLLTTSLTLNLMGNAAPGEWVEARVKVMRAGRAVVFTDCQIVCGERIIAQASAQFQVVSRVFGAEAPPSR